jgi:hypothetical protein
MSDRLPSPLEVRFSIYFEALNLNSRSWQICAQSLKYRAGTFDEGTDGCPHKVGPLEAGPLRARKTRNLTVFNGSIHRIIRLGRCRVLVVSEASSLISSCGTRSRVRAGQWFAGLAAVKQRPC